MSRLKDLPELARDGSNLSSVMQSVREVIQTFRGYRGDPLDQALTLRDLTLETRRQLQGGGLLNGTAGGTTLINPEAPVYEIDLTPPPTPEGLAASSGISHVYVECASPSYTQGHGHDRTVVYGIKWPDGAPAPVFSSAVQLFSFQGPFGAYPSDPATRWALWIKWRSNDGVLSTDPAGGTNGVVTRTGENVALLLEALTGEITESQLYVDLGSRIDLIDTPTTGLVDQVGAVKTVVNNPATGVLATAASLDAVKNTVNNATTGVTATATRVSALETTVNTGPDRNTALRASVTNEATTRADADTALAMRATNLESSVNNATTGLATKASVSQVATAKSEAIAASASVTDTISARLNTGDFAAVQVQSSASASAVTGLLAQYTVKLDVGGKVSGYGLASSSASSEFAIRADRFYIAPPETGGGDAVQIIPFSVQATATTINGVAVPAGVYINDAYVKNGTITNAKIGNAAIDDAKVANLSAAKLTAGSIGVGSYISSTAYTAGSAGWRINADGTAEFSGVVVRGTVFATAGQIGGITVASNAVRAGQTAWNTGQGFYLGANGTFSLGSPQGNRLTWDGVNLNVVSPGLTLNNGAASFSGALNAASGTFSGALQGATGSFSGELLAGTVDVSKLIGTTSTYLSPGTYNFTIPAGSNLLKVTLVGGGGGGGAVPSIYTVGTGGGGGGFTQASFSVSQGQVYTLVVGAGGAVGAAGGATYVSGVASAGGGGAGKTNSSIFTTLAGPSGGSGTVNGAAGGSAVYAQAYMQGGAGGNSAVNYGLGGAGSYYDDSTIVAPSAGLVYGGGGGGGFNSPGVSRGSLAGAHGRAVIEVSNSNGVIIRSEWLTLTAALQRQGIAIT